MRRGQVHGVNYFEHPIFILYWIALKKKISLEEWVRIIKESGKDQQEPIEKAMEFIERYKK